MVAALPSFYQVLPSCTEFYRVLPGFTEFFFFPWRKPEPLWSLGSSCPILIWFYLVLPSFTFCAHRLEPLQMPLARASFPQYFSHFLGLFFKKESYHVLQGFIEFLFSKFYRVLPSRTGFNRTVEGASQNVKQQKKIEKNRKK